MAVFTETIKLDDQVSGPAKSASSSVAKIKSTADTASTSLTKVGSGAGSKLEGVGASATKAGGGLEDASRATTDLGTSSAGTQAELAEMTGGLSVAAEAVAALAAGFGVAIIAGARFAIEMSQAKAQSIAMFQALGNGAITGVQVDDMLTDMKNKLGITKEAMTPIVQQFMAMGVTSKDALQKMTTAALSADALTGGSGKGAASFEELAKKIQAAAESGQQLKIPVKGLGALADVGLTVDDVAKKMGVSAAKLGQELKSGSVDAKKFGDAVNTALVDKGAGPLEQMSLSASNLGSLLKESIGEFFEDIDVKPFLEQVKSLFSIFSSSTEPSGKALKAGIGGGFQKIFDVATKVVPLVKHFLLDLVIYGLKAYIALKPIVKTVSDFATSATGASILSAVLDGLWTILKGLAIVVGVVVGAWLLFTAVAIGVVVAVEAVVAALIGLASKASEALQKWVTGAASAAADFVRGLVSGITAGASQIVGAVKGLADSATGAFKSALGIKSPSKVMMAIGGHMTTGMAQGIEAGAADVHGASSGVASAAVKGASSAGSATSSGKGGINVGPITIQIDGAGKTALEITEEMVASVFARMALESGL